ncbi:GMP synthase (glutamine-hydrolyzing) [Hydrogenophaga palleronii]|uniref:GMP synthase (Glutamine-hydrolyzing) n=1 Tax=Hydrogenophaga palleronii TaxID=65655 RepID=A0ABU1WS52_9BURK|nr:glutamine amidotransferase [Hydrogenophaga palleronii]MDR7152134.1 GMP synthase (glutamine-hydrolyzing) [Hydrogenophaga palleronii]
MSNALPILIVQTGRTHAHIRERLGDFDDWIAAGLREGGAEVLTHDAQGDQALPPLHSLAGIVLTGSHAMVSDREPWSEALVPWLQQAVAQSVPTLGICYGHQLLAHALGGEVTHHPQGVEIGTVQVQRHAQADGDALLGHLPPSFDAQAVHWQTVRRLPPEAVALASNAHEPHHAFRMGTRAWGVQFHPEFSGESLRAYLEGLGPTLAREGRDAAQISAAVKDTPEAASVLATFARLAQPQ